MADEVHLAGYAEFLNNLKEHIRGARIRAALNVNRELVMLYWDIGKGILETQTREGWGAGVIPKLAADLREAFPDMKGMSRSNLLHMRGFAKAWADEEAIVQQVVGQIPWGHNLVLLGQLKDRETRTWYARKAIEQGWSRAVLQAQIETRLHERQGNAVTNFSRTLLDPQSELAAQIFKDPYSFDFLTLHDDAVERDLERGLLIHLQEFMLELGVGFAFVGRQVLVEVGGQDFYIDLLFYHLKLRCFVVLDLKMGDFQPEFAGKLNFYLSAVNDLLRHADDAPSIGILLCKSQNRVVAEYTLRDVEKPLGIAEYRLADALPKMLEGALPSIEQLETELERGSVHS